MEEPRVLDRLPGYPGPIQDPNPGRAHGIGEHCKWCGYATKRGRTKPSSYPEKYAANATSGRLTITFVASVALDRAVRSLASRIPFAYETGKHTDREAKVQQPELS